MASVKTSAAPAQNPGLVTIPAQSSWIGAFEYDQTNLTLTTHLKSGAIYQHKFVLPSEFLALTTSKNHAKHWADQIKGKKASVRVKVAKAPNAGIKTGRRQDHARSR